MGFFTGFFGTDWHTAPVTGDPQWQRHESPRPDTMAVVQDGIVRSGVNPRDIDRVECVVRLWNLISGVGARYLRISDPKAGDGFEIVARRPDISEDMLWNYFSHHGAVGVAAQQKVADLFHSGQAAEVLADLIRDGDCRVALGGHDRL